MHHNRPNPQEAVKKLTAQLARRQPSESDPATAKIDLSRHAERLELQLAERSVALAATLRALKDLLYHITHNLRAPLRAVEGYSNLMASEFGPELNAAGRDYLKRMVEGARRMDTLIQDLLEYGHLGEIDLKLSNVSVTPALERVLVQLSSLAQSARADVAILGPLPDVRADARLLALVFFHLLENALRFVAAGKRASIRMWAEPHQSNVRFWVRDKGIGIDARYHERIFGPFETLHSAELYGGNGIGLAIVKLAVERMHGQVGVESRVGGGSRFWVELPQAVPEPSVVASRPETAMTLLDATDFEPAFSSSGENPTRRLNDFL